MYILKLLYSFKGNINRLEYFFGLVISTFITMFFIFYPIEFTKLNNLNPTVMKFLNDLPYVIAGINFIIANLAIACKRLRDLDWTLWLLPLFFIPFIGTFMKFLAIFATEDKVIAP